jgi:hypothetical protein
MLVLLLIFSYLLFAPFYFELDSINHICRVRFHLLASAGLIFTGNTLKIDLKIVGWRKQIDLLAGEQKPKEPGFPKKKKKRISISFRMAKAVIKSFKVTRCYLSVDSGNMLLNGLLYPGFYWLSIQTNRHIEINFMDENELVLEIENSIARITKAIIFSFLNANKYGQLK